jgi:hypothetical protein
MAKQVLPTFEKFLKILFTCDNYGLCYLINLLKLVVHIRTPVVDRVDGAE